jgi:uncharacterized membrane protein HdeD (DUF308 family)
MTVASPVETRPYCRFGKRNLEKMSWLAPLVNNRFGDALNLELRHEHLFFIHGDRVLDNVGYSEKGKRFNEADFGKPIQSLADLERLGYWLAGRVYAPEVMREALERQRDGHYYSFFSNQCQDWVDRLRRRAREVEREWGVEPGQLLDGTPTGKVLGRARAKPVPPTEPASVGMGVLALALGVGAMVAPGISAVSFAVVLGLFFAATGVSHAVYAFRGGDFRAAVPILFFAIQYLVAGGLFLLNTRLAVIGSSLLITLVLGITGISKIAVGLGSRPLKNWLGTLVAGIVMVSCAAMVYWRWPMSGSKLLGVMVGLSLIAGGLSTIYLSQRTRNEAG